MKNSGIEWTDHTFNAWEGCTKVSPGCANCYAEARNRRFAGGRNWGKGAPRRRTAISNWQQVIGWDAAHWHCADHGFVRALYVCDQGGERLVCPTCARQGISRIVFGRRPRVFCNSLADWLDDEVPIEWLADLLKLIHDTPNLDWLLLTKRPENWLVRIQDARNFLTKGGCAETAIWLNDWLSTPATSGVYQRNRQATSDHPGEPGEAPSNIWIGITVENQKCADERIPQLLKIPARVRFLSCEPLLEAIEFSDVTRRADCVAQLGKRALSGIDWVICGGESGPNKRPMDLAWARSLREQCRAAGVPFFCKQIDKVQPIPEDLLIREFPMLALDAPGAAEAVARTGEGACPTHTEKTKLERPT